MNSIRFRGFGQTLSVWSALAFAAAMQGVSGCGPDEGETSTAARWQNGTVSISDQTPATDRSSDVERPGRGNAAGDSAEALVDAGNKPDAARIVSTAAHRRVSAEQPAGGSAVAAGDVLVEAIEESGGDLPAALQQVAVRVRRGRFGDVVLVNLTGPRITDAALERIKTLDSLLVLDVWNAPITDDGVAHLAGMTQLRALGLRQTEVTDEGLQHLAGLTSLEELNLTGTAVTDAGMRHLAALKNLRALGLDDTGVLPNGVNELQVALPLCRIAW